MIASNALCAQNFPVVQDTKKDLVTNLQYEWKDKIDTNNVTHEEWWYIRDLMMKLLNVIEEKDSHIYHEWSNWETKENEVILKDSVWNNVTFVLQYDSDVSWIANNVRHDRLPEAEKTIIFTRRWIEYKLYMSFDPNHKAKLYGLKDGSKYEVRTLDWRFRFGYGGKWEKNKFAAACYDGETWKNDVKNATALLEEILRFNPETEKIQEKKSSKKKRKRVIF